MNQTDRFLLEGLKEPSRQMEAWRVLVERYQGRLIQFASRQLGGERGRQDAEDLVQETFVGFLKRQQHLGEDDAIVSIENFLFTVLRRRIIDYLRVKHLKVCLLNDLNGPSDTVRENSLSGREQTPSFYMRAHESNRMLSQNLAKTIEQLLEQYKLKADFRSLKIAEMLFYAQLKNKTIAAQVGVSEQHVALLKHRWLKQLAQSMEKMNPAIQTTELTLTSLITEVWEEHRLSCPKRSTLGHWLMEALDEPWMDYIDFHMNTLGCSFCQANLVDLKRQNAGKNQVELKQRLFDSTIGFFH